mmetsp:Transcript_26060/g.57199  ORF Transcript_26060/g.57199 Transcript_26060/m.57199 type:complete len:204 (-) Transcript_26060:798-1409(-)
MPLPSCSRLSSSASSCSPTPSPPALQTAMLVIRAPLPTRTLSKNSAATSSSSPSSSLDDRMISSSSAENRSRSSSSSDNIILAAPSRSIIDTTPPLLAVTTRKPLPPSILFRHLKRASPATGPSTGSIAITALLAPTSSFSSDRDPTASTGRLPSSHAAARNRPSAPPIKAIWLALLGSITSSKSSPVSTSRAVTLPPSVANA